MSFELDIIQLMLLSVVILSFNVRNFLKKAIQSVYSTFGTKNLQIIVVDNASRDKSPEMVKKEFPKVMLIKNKTNAGFSAGNNLARKVTKGEIVLFLNPDTEVRGHAIQKCMKILKKNKKIGAITCKVLLPDGSIDYSCHRGLPTPWNSFCYFSGLSKLFPKSKLISGYESAYLDINESHYVDCISGTFLMIRKSLLDQINWWDPDYWWNGEDIEMCYRIKKSGFKIWYEASETIVHHKGSSSGLWASTKTKVSKETKIRSAKSGTAVMRIFMGKHGKEMGPWPVMFLVNMGIFVLEKYRLWRIENAK